MTFFFGIHFIKTNIISPPTLLRCNSQNDNIFIVYKYDDLI